MFDSPFGIAPLTMRAKTKANTAKPFTIAAGVTEIPKIAGLLLLALIAAARRLPCRDADVEHGHADQKPHPEQARRGRRSDGPIEGEHDDNAIDDDR